MKLFIGIGNPDPEYTNTRHNIGKKIVSELAGDFSVSLQKKNDLSAEIAILNGKKEEKIILANSLTFMNDSGWAVKATASFFKIAPENIWIIHDDFDINLGETRVGFDSRSAGHKGVEPTIKELGMQKFNRIRIGIKPANDLRAPLEEFVLGKFRKEEMELLEKASDEAKEIIKKEI